MSKLQYFFPMGVLQKSRKLLQGHIPLKKIFAEVLAEMGVLFEDPCCTDLGTSKPVRYNTSTSSFESLENGVWTPQSSGDDFLYNSYLRIELYP